MHRCVSTSGSGKEFDEGIWTIKETEKTWTATCVSVPPIYAKYRPGKKLTVRSDKPGNHTLKDWGDGSYTAYPNRSGMPFVFTLIPNEKE